MNISSLRLFIEDMSAVRSVCWGIAFLTCLMQPSVSLAVTCTDLDGAGVQSQEGAPVCHGFFEGIYVADSIHNIYGTYGSHDNGLSERNPSSVYGSQS
jgi:hypothetical protein